MTCKIIRIVYTRVTLSSPPVKLQQSAVNMPLARGRVGARLLGAAVRRSAWTLRALQSPFTSPLQIQQLRHFAAKDSSWEWLKRPEDPKLQQFLKVTILERNYLAHQLSKPKFRRVERAFDVELRNRLLREDFSVPECIGAYEYYMRQGPGENFHVYYRRLRALGSDGTPGPEETVLNQNVEPTLNHGFQFVAGMKVSPDAKQLLLVMENDHEECRAVLRDLYTGKLEPLSDVTGIKNLEWSSSPAPHRVFYFTKVDGNGRPYAVFRYNLATHAQEKDEAFFVDVSTTKDARFVLINCNSKNTSEIYALDSHSVDARPQLLRPREPGTAYFADHAAGQFFIVTNADGALNYKIATSHSNKLKTDGASSPSGRWETMVPEQADVKIEDVDLFGNYLVLYERVASVPRIRVCKLDESEDPHYVPLPKEHEICRVAPGVNRDVTSHRLRFSVSTPLVPEIVYDYDMESRELHLLKETHLTDRSLKNESRSSRSGGVNPPQTSFVPEEYTCQRQYVASTSSLGVKVPLTLIHRRDIVLNGQNPTLLIGYGAYGTNLEADFELEHLSLLERGWVIALAHVRGGGELGLQWYQGGKGMQKRHTFDDYLSCTLHLLDAGFTNPKRLAGKGVSAGGLIMGYMANEHPELFQALVMKVPFVDILATMQDPNLPLTVHEYDEWGNPNGPKMHEYMRSYAPMENIRQNQQYPAMFVTGSLNDQRVQFWEPAKWVYRIRKAQASLPKNDKRLVLLKMSEDDGHFGGGGRLEQLQEDAMEIAFLYQALRLPFPLLLLQRLTTMATTTQELESDISQMEDRLASVKVAVEEEREAWRRSTRTGKRGTKWKGAASRRTNNERLASPHTENDFGLSDVDGNFSVMPTYWDALELAQYLQTRQLTSYAQVVVYGQITGKALLDTPTSKLRKFFADVAPTASDPSWKAFLGEVSRLHKQQRRLEAVAANNNDEILSQPCSLDSARGKNDHRPSPSAVMSAAGAALVFPLISPRLPAVSSSGTSTQQQQNNAKLRPVLPLRKPANALSSGALRQCKVYQQSKYKLDPDLFQTHAETFSSCFGATPPSNRP
ncbi:hypothetical protein BBJ28_00020782, partial [Nothophytophthora sp. Chile5]